MLPIVSSGSALRPTEQRGHKALYKLRDSQPAPWRAMPMLTRPRHGPPHRRSILQLARWRRQLLQEAGHVLAWRAHKPNLGKVRQRVRRRAMVQDGACKVGIVLCGCGCHTPGQGAWLATQEHTVCADARSNGISPPLSWPRARTFGHEYYVIEQRNHLGRRLQQADERCQLQATRHLCSGDSGGCAAVGVVCMHVGRLYPTQSLGDITLAAPHHGQEGDDAVQRCAVKAGVDLVLQSAGHARHVSTWCVYLPFCVAPLPPHTHTHTCTHNSKDCGKRSSPAAARAAGRRASPRTSAACARRPKARGSSHRPRRCRARAPGPSNA